jgi:hypothetical protein
VPLQHSGKRGRAAPSANARHRPHLIGTSWTYQYRRDATEVGHVYLHDIARQPGSDSRIDGIATRSEYLCGHRAHQRMTGNHRPPFPNQRRAHGSRRWVDARHETTAHTAMTSSVDRHPHAFRSAVQVVPHYASKTPSFSARSAATTDIV